MQNAEEAAYWNESAGPRWASLYERVDTAFAPITAALLERARPQAGEAALDVGCGCGATVFALAERLGPRGRVTGVDISKPMLALAAGRSGDHQRSNVDFVCADASTYVFDEDAFDVAVSRFGVMFFDEPVQAFANIRRSLRPDGRLTFACWRRLADNPWFHLPLDAVKPHVPAQPKRDPDAPGPFAFANADRVREILTDARFVDVELEAFDTALPLGSCAAAVDFVTQIGPVSRLVDAAATAREREAVASAIAVAFREHDSPAGVSLGAGVWIVRARRS